MSVVRLRAIGTQPNRSDCVDLDISAPQRQPDEHVIDVLEALLDSARAGHLTGIAFGLILVGGRSFVEVAGTARTDPIRARGVVRCLDDELALLVHTAAVQMTTI